MHIRAERDNWPGGICDGLELPCAVCHKHTDFDYTVTDAFWNTVVPVSMRRDVICLRCLDGMACEKGMDLSRNLLRVQYTGVGKTVVLKVFEVYHYELQGSGETT
jgi:hypothetical protein